MEIREDQWRLIAFASVVFMVAMFVWVNQPEGSGAALFYVALVLFGLQVALFAKGTKGISADWPRNALIGLLAGGGFVLLHTWQPSIIRIGYPQVATGYLFGFISTQLVVSGLLAPGGEEFGFKEVLYKRVLRAKTSFLPAAIAISIVFAAFHLTAYGLATAAFVGAFFFSMISCYLTEYTGDCVASTIMHSVVNSFLLISPFVIVGT